MYHPLQRTRSLNRCAWLVTEITTGFRRRGKTPTPICLRAAGPAAGDGDNVFRALKRAAAGTAAGAAQRGLCRHLPPAARRYSSGHGAPCGSGAVITPFRQMLPQLPEVHFQGRAEGWQSVCGTAHLCPSTLKERAPRPSFAHLKELGQ